jgi:hypothetical protein
MPSRRTILAAACLAVLVATGLASATDEPSRRYQVVVEGMT